MKFNEPKIIKLRVPKVSLNEFYASKHWANRAKIKKNFLRTVRVQTKAYFPKSKKYWVYYEFTWEKRPLDTSNCPVKLIEDILFEDDGINTVEKITVTSEKGKTKEGYNVKISIITFKD